jgi:hypothetical protein
VGASRFAPVFWFEQVALVAAAQIATHLMAAVLWSVVPQVQQPSVG